MKVLTAARKIDLDQIQMHRIILDHVADQDRHLQKDPEVIHDLVVDQLVQEVDLVQGRFKQIGIQTNCFH